MKLNLKTLKIVGATFLLLFIIFSFSNKPSDQKVLSDEVTKIPSIVQTVTLHPVATSSGEVYQVTKVIDGDTLIVNISGKNETIRVIGIDTPEFVDPRKPVQCFAKEASVMAKNILMNQLVSLEKDPTQGDKDKYDRLLRFVFLKPNVDYGKMMIEEGFAHEYTYQIPHRFQKEYREAENQARSAKRGLWVDGACVSPTATLIPAKIYFSPTNPPPTQQTQIYVPPAKSNSSGFSCSCSKTCTQMASCEEAYYQLNNCGCLARDGDSDGVPCESICN